MSAYENVVSGKLWLKGKALDVKAGGVKKKKKKKKKKEKHLYDDDSDIGKIQLQEGKSSDNLDDLTEDLDEEADKLGDKGRPPAYDDHLTPAERRYIEQREKIDRQRLAKTSNKSHRDRIQDFNQYLANMSEHYDIPKVGPG